MAADRELSPRAIARRDALLPALLAEVRARARRRRVRRAAVAVLLVAVAVLAWPLASASPHVATPREPAPVASRPTVQIVGDDPTILARCSVPTRERAQWWIRDDELQRLLASDGRTAGLVRVDGRVLVSADAVDPFPSADAAPSP